ncbi:RHS repeat-associated core domain-containing protein [Pseudomonas sp. N40(2020)]|uniref:RHS repeat domain-containing protein n=1 Tax=Pseudomonas sp. N40(2020) TaxID=2767798 RepID=UPI00292A525D|nr:RHS repeat-associated core domain-containing protein [Pseudomonas sp. N40(2020)]
MEALIARQYYNAMGAVIEKWDARLFGTTARANLATVYSLSGEPVKTDSVDAGWRLNLPGLAGEPVRRWDERGNQWRTTFDNQLRAVAVEENGEADVDVFTYADASADAGHNLRGQLLEQKDRSGKLRTNGFALPGQPLSETRTFHDSEAFTSQRVFSPLGAELEQTDAGGHRQQSRYGLAGHLKHVQLRVRGQPDWQPVLIDAHYNAADQIIEQQAGNGVRSQWTYDPADGRLHTQSSRKNTGAALQNFEYFYDRVGNITRIEDHAFQPVYFANQLVDGHRDFTYDSLYRLKSATGYDDGPLSDLPGLPKPTDPNNRLNYTQTYTYDAGGNLETLVHVRGGASRTVQMCIDSASNRGVRWKPNDPPPDFATLFDPHGNQLAVQPGQGMQWNVRDELQSVTLVARGNGRDDAEYYRYSQGVRVFKRHETFTDTTEHFHQVRYLPGLEIRTKDNGEELHVISVGSARCLHWAKKPPRGVEDNQLRYSLEDHLGSCTMELDQNAEIISQEGYYPFGATAWMLAKFLIEVSYRFIRYSGKEMDVSGLYYYGARYYAPWLQRWISADPAGDVDGLNLYGFVSNNPLIFIDGNGTKKDLAIEKQNVEAFSNVLEILGNELQSLDKQLNNLFSARDITKRAGIITAFQVTKGLVGTAASKGTESLTGIPLLGSLASFISGKIMDKVGSATMISTPILPDAQKLKPQAIYNEANISVLTSPLHFVKKTAKPYDPRTTAGAKKLFDAAESVALGKAGVPAASELLAIRQTAEDAASAMVLGIPGTTIDDLDNGLILMIKLLERDRSYVNAAFANLEINEFYSEGLAGTLNLALDLAKDSVGTDKARTIRRDQIQKDITLRIAQANRGRELLGKYRQYSQEKAA